jgi:hypothetical protein
MRFKTPQAFSLDKIISDPANFETDILEKCPVACNRERYNVSSEREKKCKLCNEHGLYFHRRQAYYCGLYGELIRTTSQSAE